MSSVSPETRDSDLFDFGIKKTSFLEKGIGSFNHNVENDKKSGRGSAVGFRIWDLGYRILDLGFSMYEIEIKTSSKSHGFFIKRACSFSVEDKLFNQKLYFRRKQCLKN